jgi:predicted acylesterase/phospholipase RssA
MVLISSFLPRVPDMLLGSGNSLSTLIFCVLCRIIIFVDKNIMPCDVRQDARHNVRHNARHNVRQRQYKSTSINHQIDAQISALVGSNTPQTHDTLVLSGGSIRGIAQIGALHCLDTHGMLTGIRCIAGTSAGSMVGLLVCVGYTPIELFDLMKQIDLKKAQSANPITLIKKYGMDDGTRIIMILSKLLGAKNYSSDITFKQLYTRTHINLIVTGTCVNDKKIYYFSHSNFPDMRVLDAVRISIAVPVMFTPAVFEGKTFIDGGIIDNFPIRLFEHTIDSVIGIYVSEQKKYIDRIRCIEDYLTHTIHCVLEGVSCRDTQQYDKHVIKIDCTASGESLQDIICMFDDGYAVALKKIQSGDLTRQIVT